MTVGVRFETFLKNIGLTPTQVEDGRNAHQSVRRCLNTHYYGYSSSSANSMLIGSWGKDTEIRPPRDIDILFVLPDSMKWKYTTGNVQSQILQDVKRVLLGTFSRTDVRGDGPVVVVPFAAYSVEVCPAFKRWDNKYEICITTNGGSYKTFDPDAEIANVRRSNDGSSGNTRHLIRMLKKWQEQCAVPMKSFWLELLAVNFIDQWGYKGKGYGWYDWMVRDFFIWLDAKGQSSYNFLSVPGTGELLSIGNAWASKASSAKDRANKAIQYDAEKLPCTSGGEWQKIFGPDMPQC